MAQPASKPTRSMNLRIQREWRNIPYPCRIKRLSDGSFRIEEVIDAKSPVEQSANSVLQFNVPNQ